MSLSVDIYQVAQMVLDRLQNGQPVEEIIAAYPEYAAQLKGILQTANVSAASANIVIPAAAMAACQVAFLSSAALIPPPPPPPAAPAALGPVNGIVLSTATILVVATCLILGSSNTLPRDILYPVKQLVQQVTPSGICRGCCKLIRKHAIGDGQLWN